MTPPPELRECGVRITRPAPGGDNTGYTDPCGAKAIQWVSMPGLVYGRCADHGLETGLPGLFITIEEAIIAQVLQS